MSTANKISENNNEINGNEYTHLERTTDTGSGASYCIAPGYSVADLTGEERYILSGSLKEMKKKALSDDRLMLQRARMDFKRLAAISGLPAAAADIINEWVK